MKLSFLFFVVVVVAAAAVVQLSKILSTSILHGTWTIWNLVYKYS
jgi:hypothetical protein